MKKKTWEDTEIYNSGWQDGMKNAIEQLAIWIADNIAPIDKQDMPQIFKNERRQDILWEEVCSIMRY